MRPLSEREAAQRLSTVHALGLQIELDLHEAHNPKEKFFRTKVVWQLQVESSETFLDFVGEVISVQGPTSLRWEHQEGRIWLRGLPIGAPFSLEIISRCEFSRTGEGLHRVVDPQDNHCYVYTHCEPNDAQRYFPCFDQPSIKTPVTWTVVARQDWEVITNGVKKNTSTLSHGYTKHDFLPTPPLPAYLTAMSAGPFAYYRDEYERPDGTRLRLGLYCRASRQNDFDPEDVFTVTKQGLQYFETAYQYPYPWGKYDQVFVPEYNIGAMENPGCVTFNEDAYVFYGPATEARRAKRADTILHEMCHMWFGDLVTPHWWDDLWLKESFADYSGHAAAKSATRYQDEQATVSVGRKEWAYRFDQYPSTHPILGKVNDTQMARQAFDAITYAKGAAVLSQLVAAVGENNFHGAVREYFQKNAHKTATLADFLQALGRHCDLDVERWSQQWLGTVGPTQFHLELRCNSEAVITKANLVQSNRDFCRKPTNVKQGTQNVSAGEETVIRPHLLKIGCYDLIENSGGDPSVERRDCLDVFTDQESTEISQLLGRKRPDLLLLNDEDLTYAICVPDARSQEFLVAHLSKLPTLEAQGVAWSTLWNAVRDTRLPAPIFARALLEHLPDLRAQSMLVTLLDRTWYTLARYLPTEAREHLVGDFLSLAWERVQWYGKSGTARSRARGGDIENVGMTRAWVGGVLKFANLAQSEANIDLATEILSELETSQVVEIDVSLRWIIAEARATLGTLSPDELSRLAQDDPSVAGQAAFLKISNLLTADSGRALVTESKREHTNEELNALIQAFNHPSHSAFCAHWVGEYLSEVPHQYTWRSQAMALKWVSGFFPSWIRADQPGSHQAITQIETWLDQQSDESLRRCVEESLAELKRDLAVQRKADIKPVD